MQASRLDSFLPVRFRNGTVIKQFSKPCVHCGAMLHARHMHGVARLIDDRLALAATADCPECHRRFGVACVIDHDKRVRRVTVPAWLFSGYLRLLPEQPGEKAARDMALQTVREESPPTPAPAVDYPRADTYVGRYRDLPIPAYIVVDGRQVPFDRVEPQGRIGQGEFLLDGCFVYKPAP
ncbi:hypothetical protein [Chitinimonas lacunae]|uniref:Restriction endonuclease n=1 Tax=Chitinimonas lacunae TaxID=1963018 RepID=A0ABV8MPY5_9NEIS